MNLFCSYIQNMVNMTNNVKIHMNAMNALISNREHVDFRKGLENVRALMERYVRTFPNIEKRPINDHSLTGVIRDVLYDMVKEKKEKRLTLPGLLDFWVQNWGVYVLGERYASTGYILKTLFKSLQKIHVRQPMTLRIIQAVIRKLPDEDVLTLFQIAGFDLDNSNVKEAYNALFKNETGHIVKISDQLYKMRSLSKYTRDAVRGLWKSYQSSVAVGETKNALNTVRRLRSVYREYDVPWSVTPAQIEANLAKHNMGGSQRVSTILMHRKLNSQYNFLRKNNESLENAAKKLSKMSVLKEFLDGPGIQRIAESLLKQENHKDDFKELLKLVRKVDNQSFEEVDLTRILIKAHATLPKLGAEPATFRQAFTRLYKKGFVKASPNAIARKYANDPFLQPFLPSQEGIAKEIKMHSETAFGVWLKHRGIYTFKDTGSANDSSVFWGNYYVGQFVIRCLHAMYISKGSQTQYGYDPEDLFSFLKEIAEYIKSAQKSQGVAFRPGAFWNSFEDRAKRYLSLKEGPSSFKGPHMGMFELAVSGRATCMDRSLLLLLKLGTPKVVGIECQARKPSNNSNNNNNNARKTKKLRVSHFAVIGDRANYSSRTTGNDACYMGMHAACTRTDIYELLTTGFFFRVKEYIKYLDKEPNEVGQYYELHKQALLQFMDQISRACVSIVARNTRNGRTYERAKRKTTEYNTKASRGLWITRSAKPFREQQKKRKRMA